MNASICAWHDKIDQSVRQVERQIAALRLGITLKTGAELTEEEVVIHKINVWYISQFDHFLLVLR